MMRIFRAGIVGAVIVFLFGPLIVVGVASLNANQFLDFPVTDFSGRWYQALFSEPGWRNALLNSLKIAVPGAGLSVLVALPMAFALHRWKPRFASAFMALGVLPFMLPPVISAVGALVLWNELGSPGQIQNVIIAHGVFFSSVPLITITLGIRAIDPAVEEAATTLGADEWRRFRTVTLPLLLPSVVTGYVAAFVLSLNEYIIAFMVAGFTVETLPIKIFNSLRYGFTPTIAAVAIVFTGISVGALALLARFGSLDRLLGAGVSDR